MLEILVVNDKKTIGRSIGLNLSSPEIRNAIRSDFKDEIEVSVAEGENTIQLIASVNAFLGQKHSFAVTVLDMHMDGVLHGGSIFLERFAATNGIAKLGQILLISDKTDQDDPEVKDIIKRFSAIYRRGSTKAYRQDALRNAISAYNDKCKKDG